MVVGKIVDRPMFIDQPVDKNAVRHQQTKKGDEEQDQRFFSIFQFGENLSSYITQIHMNVTHLFCSSCHKEYEPGKLYNLCAECSKPLLAAYDMDAVKKTLTRESLAGRVSSLWRYEEILPVSDNKNRVTLCEGWTPLHRAENLGRKLGLTNFLIKDESLNPTQSFKERGMTMAVS